MPKNKCLFQAKLLDDSRYSQWLRKKSDYVALIFNIDTFIFTYLDTVQIW